MPMPFPAVSCIVPLVDPKAVLCYLQQQRDRKSTRLNSSHTVISYAVFCLRKEEHTSAVQSHSLVRSHGLLQTPAAGLCRCARTVEGTSRPGQQLLPRSVGRRLPLPGQRRAFWQGRRRMVKPETPAKKHYVMCDTWRKE